jgi:hypothetical protein
MIPIAVAVVDWEPFGNGAGGCGKTAAFANAKQQTTCHERDDAAGQTVARARQRPENHDAKKSAARS